MVATGVSIRKSCERACRRPAWRLATAMPVLSLFARVLSGGWRLCPGAEVFGAGVPGQEPFQRPAGERLAAVATAFVQVGGEVGQDVQPGHLGGRGDGPDDGGVPGGVPSRPTSSGGAIRSTCLRYADRTATRPGPTLTVTCSACTLMA